MNKKKNILFLLLSLPDLNENSNIYSDLIQEFDRNGENIFVVAPSVNNEETRINKEKGLEILRVRTLPLFGVGTIRKGIANILLPYQFYKAIQKYYTSIQFDTIIIPTPPITLESLVSKLKNKHKASVYLILRDIFPQNAVDLGMMKKASLVYTYFRNHERRLYNISDHIGCMSLGNVDYIVNHNIGINSKKLHVLMNFQKVLPKDRTLKSDLKNKYGLDGKFVVVFGGNLGVPQKMENVISFAQVIEKKYSDV
ncbi:MAG: glycosyltransferase WbuB, partial [Bacteroidales bacterium]